VRTVAGIADRGGGTAQAGVELRLALRGRKIEIGVLDHPVLDDHVGVGRSRGSGLGESGLGGKHQAWQGQLRSERS
jgi:hypothetical protein